MKDQYKVLIEKYNKVQEAYGFVSESIFWETVKSGVPEDDIEDFIRWYMVNTEHAEGFKEIQESTNCTDLEAICYVYDAIQKQEYDRCKEIFWGDKKSQTRTKQCREEVDTTTVAAIMTYYNEDYKNWKATRDELYKNNPGVNIDI